VKFNLNDEPLTVNELKLIPYYRYELLLSQTKKTVIVDVIIVTSVMQAEGVGTG
jgi:hypothetical protein